MKLSGYVKGGMVILLGAVIGWTPVWSQASSAVPAGTVIQETVVVQPVPAQTPPGWTKGRKTGWTKHGTVMPPGLQKNLTGKGKYPRGLQKPQ